MGIERESDPVPEALPSQRDTVSHKTGKDEKASLVPETVAHVATSESRATTEVQVPGYEIIGRLGRGGMGVVYKARDLRLDRLVALKMIRSGEQASAAEAARFHTEAQAAARIQHPN